MRAGIGLAADCFDLTHDARSIASRFEGEEEVAASAIAARGSSTADDGLAVESADGDEFEVAAIVQSLEAGGDIAAAFGSGIVRLEEGVGSPANEGDSLGTFEDDRGRNAIDSRAVKLSACCQTGGRDERRCHRSSSDAADC